MWFRWPSFHGMPWIHCLMRMIARSAIFFLYSIFWQLSCWFLIFSHNRWRTSRCPWDENCSGKSACAVCHRNADILSAACLKISEKFPLLLNTSHIHIRKLASSCNLHNRVIDLTFYYMERTCCMSIGLLAAPAEQPDLNKACVHSKVWLALVHTFYRLAPFAVKFKNWHQTRHLHLI